jgi:hypothetical protein
MMIPEGTTLVGKRHRYECINIVIGQARVVNVADEADTVDLDGLSIFVSPAGTKRAIHAISAVHWTTFHATDERDLEILESAFLEDG